MDQRIAMFWRWWQQCCGVVTPLPHSGDFGFWHSSLCTALKELQPSKLGLGPQPLICQAWPQRPDWWQLRPQGGGGGGGGGEGGAKIFWEGCWSWMLFRLELHVDEKSELPGGWRVSYQRQWDQKVVEKKRSTGRRRGTDQSCLELPCTIRICITTKMQNKKSQPRLAKQKNAQPGSA